MRPLAELTQRDDFIGRHIGPRADDKAAMLRLLGLKSMDELAAKAVPEAIPAHPLPAIGDGCTESAALARLRQLANKNKVFKSFIGLGYANCHVPPVIQRNILENPGWYTSYTPYQAEISQGRLEAVLNFQTLVADLSGLELANSSMLDEATAAAEAMTLCRRVSKSPGNTFFISDECHPQTIEVVRTRAIPLGIDIVVGDHRAGLDGLAVFGVLLQYPSTTGAVHDYADIVAKAHAQQALVTVAADLLSLMVLKAPGEFGADVCVGSAQRFGVPLGFGGPHAGFLATRNAFKRAVPGRLVGVSIDANGDPAYRMALQTREQHIRREKATSNICTAQALLAVLAGMYAVYHGPDGLKTIAERVHRLTAVLAAGLRQLGFTVQAESFFDTVFVDTGLRTEAIHAAARQREVNLRAVDANTIGISLDETTTAADLTLLWEILAGPAGGGLSVAELDAATPDALPKSLRRQGEVLTHPVFHLYRSETDMLRYMRRLADRDLALDRTMIPLGSCTMKLNATTEMIPVTWPEFSGIHPFAPLDQAAGYLEMIADLERDLCVITGYDAVSLQPNAGSQGEYAGLLAIAAYHQSRGEAHRDVCLIPSSAHGTNAASAHMAGMRVVVVQCDQAGNVDIDDLREKAEAHGGNLAALMVTYPSTHGVFEDAIMDVCAIVHDHGGQVYIDGANMNAMVGLCAPGTFGGDVSHLNLHKTFCIPHGGGGPGVGPVCVRQHLAPFLPGNPIPSPGAEKSAVGPVSAAPWGSAGILPISWAYIKMMGRKGLTEATRTAILSANYIAKRLEDHYPVLYTGANGLVAHECIIDLRPLKETSGISVDDVAKRLIDYGFHAPTMSFPVAGTLMIEPTESEPKEELDRFCEAMIRIREEIRAVEQGEMDPEDNPLRNAPHTAAMLLADPWTHPYSREQAAFPLPSVRTAKYWPVVARIDNSYGDRNLVCTCPPMAAYQDVA